LKVGGAISGHVYQEDGVTPVQGSCFFLAADDPLSEDSRPYCLSDQEGEYTIPGLYSGIYYLRTWADGLGLNPSLLDKWYTPDGGTVDPALAAPIDVITGSTASGITFTLGTECIVANTADSGLGTLRQCLELAEEGDTITFDPDIFPPGKPATITLVSDLPPLFVDNVTIDGSGAGVIVEGSGFHIWSDGNRIQGLQIYNAWTGIEVGGGGSYNVISGNVLSGHGWAGVDIHDTGSMSNTVIGNLIGTDATGTVALGNGTGVKVRDGAQYNVIGGDTPAERNVISGSDGENIADGIDLGASSYNVVIGNYIGTDIHGTTALPNMEAGVGICCGASHNTIGGTGGGERNIISGNGSPGVRVFGTGTDYNVIRGNYIGTDPTGTMSVPNNTGVLLWNGARYNVVGGTNPGEGNLISGNSPLGITISAADTMSNTVVGNLIGTDPAGTAALGNSDGGISIEEASYNVIGGNTPGERNLISGNGGSGVVMLFDANHNTVSGNYIGTDITGAVALPNQGNGVQVAAGSSYNVIGGPSDTTQSIISNTTTHKNIGVAFSGTASVGNAKAGASTQAGLSESTISRDDTPRTKECSGACNLISGNSDDGIALDNTGTVGNTIRGNFVGTDETGSYAVPNQAEGISLWDGSSDSLIQNNLVSGNGEDGIAISEGSNGNTVSGNYIGTDASGAHLVPNGYIGIVVVSSEHNMIGGINGSPGGDCTGECNLVSGNDYGVEMFYATNITVTGNYIGTDVSGMAWLSSNVVQVGGAYNRIGGTEPGEGNVIAGPLWLAPPYEGPHHHQVIGNYIGVDATGTTCIGQGWGGIGVGGSDHVIGGDMPEEGNQICGYDHWGISVSGTGNLVGHNTVYGSGEDGILVTGSDNLLAHNEIHENADDGVEVRGETALHNTCTENSIHDNGGPGISLVEGGNTELPAPVVLTYDVGAGTATGTACALCTVEVFSDEDDEGQWYEGTSVADALGHWSFDKGDPFTGANVHATATDAEGNTSEFSCPLHDIAVVGAAPGGEVRAGEPNAVYAELLNVGSHPENNVPVRCSIEKTGYDETRTSAEIQPATWAMVAFPDWVPAAGGVFTLTCESLLADENLANDVFSQQITATIPGPPDVWTKDNNEDTGDVPSTQPWWISPDIWVRHQPDGGLVHQNAIAFQENTVYVRIRNRGESSASGVVQVFWDRSRIGWPCKLGEPNVGNIPFKDLAPGEMRILSLPWTPQEPGEHGLHTVIEAEGDPADWSAPCSPHRPRWDNNVSWHNVIAYFHPSYVAQSVLSTEEVEVDLVNVYDWPKDTDLIIGRSSFPVTGAISLQLDQALFDRWWNYEGGWQQGLAVNEATEVITIVDEISATIGGLPLEAGEEVTATLVFDTPEAGAFEVQMHERIDGLVVGGITYQWIDSDVTLPAVETTSPANGAVEVAPDAPIVVTFTEPIGPLSLDLAVEPDPGGWHLGWNKSNTVLTATHGEFALTTTYMATVMARDAFANAMEEPYTWTFYTGQKEHRLYLPLVMREN
ncbi:MAG: right-handed parallel beta-helix repeat-containing protein, partial [Anaerolineae bacterium]